VSDAPRLRRRVRDAVRNPRTDRLRAPWRLLATTLLVAASLLAAGVVAAGLRRSLGLAGLTGSVLGPLAVTAAVVGSVAVAGRYLDRRRLADYGLRVDRAWLRDLGFGLALGVALMAGVFALELAAGWARVTGTFVARGPFLPALLSAAVLFACVGLYEELLVRGYLLTNLAEALSSLGDRVAVAAATVLSAAVFGVAHAGNPNATAVSTLAITLAGVVLALGYVLTDELAVPVGLHVTWNFAQGTLFGFPVSGQSVAASVVAVEVRGPTALTGGAFGPEAGLVGVLAILVGGAAIAGWVRWQHGPLRVHPGVTTPVGRGTDPDPPDRRA
jgi:hypothetical protein